MFDNSQISAKAFLVREVCDMVMAPSNLRVEKIFLVGSYAQGRENEWSDLDFLVQFRMKNGIRYPTWNQAQEIQRNLSESIHIIYGTEEAQKSMWLKNGDKYKYREIALSKESLC